MNEWGRRRELKEMQAIQAVQFSKWGKICGRIENELFLLWWWLSFYTSKGFKRLLKYGKFCTPFETTLSTISCFRPSWNRGVKEVAKDKRRQHFSHEHEALRFGFSITLAPHLYHKFRRRGLANKSQNSWLLLLLQKCGVKLDPLRSFVFAWIPASRLPESIPSFRCWCCRKKNFNLIHLGKRGGSFCFTNFMTKMF